MRQHNTARFIQRMYDGVRKWSLETVLATLSQLASTTRPQNDTVFWRQFRMVLTPAKGDLR